MLTAQQALDELKAGNQRFVQGQARQQDWLADRAQTANGQQPFAFILGCMDSRVAPEYVFDQPIGALFVGRLAGNLLNDDIIASIQYAHLVVGTPLVLVLGHSGCGAVKAACDPNPPPTPELQGLVAKIATENAADADDVAKRHAIRQSALLRRAFENHPTLIIHPALYTLATGVVDML